MSRTHKLPLVKVAKFSLSFRYLRCLLYVVRCILILYKKCIPGLSLSDCNCSSLQTRLGPKIYIHQHDKKEAYQDPTIIDYRSIDINYCVQVSSTARYVFVSSYLKNWAVVQANQIRKMSCPLPLMNLEATSPTKPIHISVWVDSIERFSLTQKYTACRYGRPEHRIGDSEHLATGRCRMREINTSLVSIHNLLWYIPIRIEQERLTPEPSRLKSVQTKQDTQTSSSHTEPIEYLRDSNQPFTYDIRFSKKSLTLEFYDTAYQNQHWSTLQPDVIVLAFDISSRESLAGLKNVRIRFREVKKEHSWRNKTSGEMI